MTLPFTLRRVPASSARHRRHRATPRGMQGSPDGRLDDHSVRRFPQATSRPCADRGPGCPPDSPRALPWCAAVPRAALVLVSAWNLSVRRGNRAVASTTPHARVGGIPSDRLPAPRTEPVPRAAARLTGACGWSRNHDVVASRDAAWFPTCPAVGGRAVRWPLESR